MFGLIDAFMQKSKCYIARVQIKMKFHNDQLVYSILWIHDIFNYNNYPYEGQEFLSFSCQTFSNYWYDSQNK